MAPPRRTFVGGRRVNTKKRLGSPFPQQSSDYKTDVRRPFPKPSHEVREPFTTDWDVYADAEPTVTQFRLKVPSNAVQHLELVTPGRDPSRCGIFARRVNHVRVVGRD